MSPVVVGELEVVPALPLPEPGAPVTPTAMPGPAERDSALESDLARLAARRERLHAD